MARVVSVPASHGSINDWLLSPNAAYTPLSQMQFLDPSTYVVLPSQVPIGIGQPIDVRGDPSLYTIDVKALDFPSLKTIFSKPRNLFGN